MNWKAGDIAICINNTPKSGYNDSPPLRLQAEYVVGKVRNCECGEVDLDVGIYDINGLGVTCNCGAISSPKSGIWWCDAVRFKKKEYAEEVIKQVFQTEEA